MVRQQSVPSNGFHSMGDGCATIDGKLLWQSLRSPLSQFELSTQNSIAGGPCVLKSTRNGRAATPVAGPTQSYSHTTMPRAMRGNVSCAVTSTEEFVVVR